MNETIVVFSDDTFFRNFRYLKEKYCLSRRALSRLLDMSVYAITRMENNTWGSELELQKLKRIAQIFPVNFEDLVSKDLSKQG